MLIDDAEVEIALGPSEAFSSRTKENDMLGNGIGRNRGNQTAQFFLFAHGQSFLSALVYTETLGNPIRTGIPLRRADPLASLQYRVRPQEFQEIPPGQDLYSVQHPRPIFPADQDEAPDPALLAEGSKARRMLLLRHRGRLHLDGDLAVEDEVHLVARERTPVREDPPRPAVIDPGPELEEDEVLEELPEVRALGGYRRKPPQGSHDAEIEEIELGRLDGLALDRPSEGSELESRRVSTRISYQSFTVCLGTIESLATFV